MYLLQSAQQHAASCQNQDGLDNSNQYDLPTACCQGCCYDAVWVGKVAKQQTMIIEKDGDKPIKGHVPHFSCVSRIRDFELKFQTGNKVWKIHGFEILLQINPFTRQHVLLCVQV